MTDLNLLTLSLLITPIALAGTAVVSWLQPGLRPTSVKKLSMASALLGLFVSAAGAIFTWQYGVLESGLLGVQNFGFSLRLDALSMLMIAMISIIGFIVVKFSQNYLDGDTRQGAFLGRLAATIASVQLLVLAGNLGLLLFAWVLTSMSLHRLLIFYQERPGAIIAARKKFIIARISDVALAAAVVLLYNAYSTGNLQQIFNQVQVGLQASTIPTAVSAAAICLVIAALFKSAQFPSHGWLLEVMETPTPVSALLHAGLLNAGPFLMVRLAPVLEMSHTATVLLIGVAGFTALFGSVVYLTQTSIKTALSFSSIAHMGFSLMMCGLGAYPAAMLHLVAHSFYKAHSFLSSGSVIDQMRASRVAAPSRLGNPVAILAGILVAATIYAGTAWLWGVSINEELPMLAIGSVIVMGLASLLASTFDSKGSLGMIGIMISMTALVASCFFFFESAMHYLLSDLVPVAAQLTFTESIILFTLLGVFTFVTIIQIISPLLKRKNAYQVLAVHLRNGLYINIIFDRMVGTWRTKVLAQFTEQNSKSEEMDAITLKQLKELAA